MTDEIIDESFESSNLTSQRQKTRMTRALARGAARELRLYTATGIRRSVVVVSGAFVSSSFIQNFRLRFRRIYASSYEIKTIPMEIEGDGKGQSIFSHLLINLLISILVSQSLRWTLQSSSNCHWWRDGAMQFDGELSLAEKTMLSTIGPRKTIDIMVRDAKSQPGCLRGIIGEDHGGG